mgnify:CR=1 FL=1
MERPCAALGIAASTLNNAELADKLIIDCEKRNERLGMVKHVPGINANRELLGFRDFECLLDVGVEGPVSEPRQGVGSQDTVLSGFGLHEDIHSRIRLVSLIQKQ